MGPFSNSIGGAAFGLSIASVPLAAGDAKDSAAPSTYAYGSGARFDGAVALAKVTVGELSQAFTVQGIKAIGCLAAIPDCPVSREALKDYGIQGDGTAGQGFKAIIGVGMADADAASPLSAVGPKPGSSNCPCPAAVRPAD